MDIKKKIIKADRAFFNDSRGQRLEDIFSEIRATQTLPHRAIEEGYNLGREFKSLFPNSVYTNQEIEISDALQFSKVYSIHLFPEPNTRTQDFRFEVMLAYFSGDIAQIINRRLPIVWRMDHVEERFLQRADTDLKYAQDLSKTVHLGLAMGRVFDRQFKGSHIKEAPFILPFREGLLLGVCTPEKPEMTFNRVGRWAVSGESAVDPYLWQPRIAMNIKTYIGPVDMKPGQRRLYEIMTDRFMGEQDYAVLQTGMDFYRASLNTDLNDFRRYTRPDIIEAHDRVLSDIENLMMSRLWRGSVSLPGMHRLGQGVIQPKFF